MERGRPVTAPPTVHEVLRSPGYSLDGGIRDVMESHFGHDFGLVRVHTDRRAAESARAVSARAYTVGRHIVFDSGEYQPHTLEGRHLLAHELTHVLQQGGPRVSELQGTEALRVADPNHSLERQAADIARSLTAPIARVSMGRQTAEQAASVTGSTGLLQRESEESSSMPPEAEAAQEVNPGTPAASSLVTMNFTERCWATNVHESANFSLPAGSTLHVTGSLSWTGPSRCRGIASNYYVHVMKSRSLWFDEDVCTLTFPIGRSTTLSCSIPTAGTYYLKLELGGNNGDPEHCCLVGTVSATI